MSVRRSSAQQSRARFATKLKQQQQAHEQHLRQQELAFEARVDRVVADYHQARAEFERLQQQCQQLREKLATQQQTAAHAQRVLTLKQEAISQLLAAHPHPISPELQYRIQAA